MTESRRSTATLLFTDIEGSTRLETQVGTARYGQLRERHRVILRSAFDAQGGVEQGTEGDSFFVTFGSARDAIAAAVAGQRGLFGEPWPDGLTVRVRMGLHSGETETSGGSLVGLDINRASRIAGLAHGGQIVVSAAVHALVGAALPAGASWRDLGEHRLRDLETVERLWQVVIDGLPSEFPALRSVGVPVGNLPTRLTTFVGRDRELAEVLELAAAGRLLTLTGPGGTGKTRLSLEVGARSADRYPDGVYFVPLEPITEASLVAATIAQRLSLPDRGGPSPVDRLREHLHDRRLLIILDNFEQVIDAAPLVSELLADAPGLGILATSREALRVYGEREYPVPPLAVPEPNTVRDTTLAAQYGAVELFLERARAVMPSFGLTDDNLAAVVEICYRLDGLPLAIELAAARVKLLSPGAMLSRLQHRLSLLGSGSRDLPARQQTLRGAIGWSYDLLDPADRDLFACFSVFAGATDLESVEAVCASAATDVLESLSSLVDKSLIRRRDAPDGEARYRMLETIREYAAERLEEAGRTPEMRARHASWCVSRVQASAEAAAGGRRATLDRLEADHDDFRAAINWSIEAGDATTAFALTAGLWRFWQMRGYISEGLERLDAALALPGCDDERLRVAALDAAGGLAYWNNDQDRARRRYEEALAIERSRGDPGGIANALYNLSFTYTFQESTDIGEQLVREAIDLYEVAGDKVGLARVRWGLANIEYAKGPEHAQAAYDLASMALATFKEVDDRFMVGWATYTLALAEFLRGFLDESHARLVEALRMFRVTIDVSGYTLVLDALAGLALRQGDRLRAARIAGAVDTLERTSGTGLNRSNRAFFEYDPEPLRTSPDTAAAFAAGVAMETEAAIDFALGVGADRP
jgi:predicted ATPase/class 3 adenylate cyclase